MSARFPDWTRDAACARLRPDQFEIFFPAKGEIIKAEAARTICRGCPVKAQCLAWGNAVARDYGVFGGLTPGQRRSRRPGGAVAERRNLAHRAVRRTQERDAS